MFRWTIFGTGAVARKFVLGLRAASDMGAVTVASRTRANAERFARDLGLTAAESYEAAAAAPADAVYIATPPSEHARHAVLCLEAGKPVLIEKPFTATTADARAILQTAAARNLFAMEAMWTRFLPAVRRLKALVADGAIGEPRSAAGSFCIANAPDPAANLFSPALGGGALLHRGVYPLSLAAHLLGPVRDVAGLATVGPTGVDEDISLSLRHEAGALSTVRASLRASAPLDFQVIGTDGSILIDPPIFRPFRLTITRTTPRGGEGSGGGRFEALKEGKLQAVQQRLGPLVRLLRSGRTETHAYAGNGYHHQADEVRARIRAGERESPIMPLAESLHLVEVMERARQ